MPDAGIQRQSEALDGRTGRRLDLSSWDDYLAGLELEPEFVTRAGGHIVAGPARPIAALALRLGLGQAFLDTPHTRQILANLGVDPGLAPIVARRLRRLEDWRPVWQDLAAPVLRRAEQARLAGAMAAAIEATHTALTLLGLAYGGDGYYIYTPYAEQHAVLGVRRQLHEHLRALTGARIHRQTFVHARGTTMGLLHLPADGVGPFPTIVGLHPLGGDKDDFDTALARFRTAGFATCVIDLPAHGDGFDGPRLRFDDELVVAAALDHLAGRPEINPRRLAVLGGSLGALFALRAAAASPRVAAAVAYASPFDVGSGIDLSVPGIRANFATVVGAQPGEPLGLLTHDFHLHTALERITCPVLLVHGTADHICDFTATYEIARRVRSGVTVWPVLGGDHEVANPGAPHLSDPAITWLQRMLD